MDKKLTSVQVARRRVADIEAQIERCDTAINQMAASNERLEVLIKERTDALANSFLGQAPADTSDCDGRIAAAEKEATRLREAAAGASAAREILVGQLKDAQKDVKTAQVTMRAQRVEQLCAVYSQARDEYGTALAALRASLDRMDAVAHLINRYQPEARIPHGGAHYLRDALSNGLVDVDRNPVNLRFRKSDPEIAKEIAVSLGLDDD